MIAVDDDQELDCSTQTHFAVGSLRIVGWQQREPTVYLPLAKDDKSIDDVDDDTWAIARRSLCET